jgi:hypothetical protein
VNPDLVRLEDMPPCLLRALAEMRPNLRDAWIDQYVNGWRLNSWGRDKAALACGVLRELFGSTDAIREAA